MTDYELANTVLRGISAVAALGSVTAILIGLRQMRQSTEERARREDQRHAESMEALRSNHTESMEVLRSNHAESMEALRQQGESLRQQDESLRGLIRGMETLIERTSPKRDSQ